MYTVYVIKSTRYDWIYIGMTSDFEKRIKSHNSGYNKSTKSKAPFEILHIEKFPDTKSAREREKYLKTTTGKRFIRKNYLS